MANCELLGKAKKPSSECLISHVNIHANRAAIVSSVITKIFNPSMYWMVTIEPLFLMTLFWAVLVFFIASFYCLTFVQLSAFCSIRFIFQCLHYSVNFLSWYRKCPDVSIPLYNIQQAVNKHHTADSVIFCLSIGSERPTYYSPRHRGISGTNFSIRVKQMARQVHLMYLEGDLDNASGDGAGPQHVHLGGQIIGEPYPLHLRQEVGRRVQQLEQYPTQLVIGLAQQWGIKTISGPVESTNLNIIQYLVRLSL